tara:strand:+ start:269 stop:649 length:381 start_codon:yes stop_codon:yes gene_type:complete
MTTYIHNFKATNFSKRLAEATRVAEKHPDRVSIIVGCSENTDIPEIDKHKFLVPRDLTVGQFVHVIRKRIDVSPEKALFLFCNKIMPVASSRMGDVYDKNKDHDGFLYITYASENTFGHNKNTLPF